MNNRQGIMYGPGIVVICIICIIAIMAIFFITLLPGL